MKDAIAEMIIKIKNAGNAGKEFVSVPFSKLRLAVADVLAKEGFIKSVSKVGEKVIKNLNIEIAYLENGAPRIKGVEKVSKFSKRIYKGTSDIKPFKYGYGMIIYSTPKGILTGKEAKKENVGGEVLFKIW